MSDITPGDNWQADIVQLVGEAIGDPGCAPMFYNDRIRAMKARIAELEEQVQFLTAAIEGRDTRGDIIATDKDKLRAAVRRIVDLEKQVRHLCADAAETDSDIRESAKRVLPAERVDGDRECVPPLAEVVERVVGQVAALRADAEALVRAVADYFDFGERQLLKDARNKMNRTLDVARAAKQ